MIEALLQDLRFGLRLLRRSPGFTAAAVITLALGTGATTALFSVANAVIFRPLPFPGSERVMTVLAASEAKPYPPADSLYVEWRDRQQCFDLMAAAVTSTKVLRDGGGAREIRAAQVSADFLPLLGVKAAAGRLFTRHEDTPGRDNVALLADGFWRSEFAASPAVLGETVSLDGRAFTVIGVLPAELRFPGFGPRDLWIPLAAEPRRDGGGRGNTLVLGRLRDGAAPEAAQAEMTNVTAQVRGDIRAYRAPDAVVVPLRDWLASDARTTLLMLAGAAAFLLLIGCANLANLLLARGAGRKQELAVRVWLGAGRGRLAAQMFAESALLAAMGGLSGIALAYACVRAAPAVRGINIPRAEEIAVDCRFLLIGLGVSVASGIVFGLAPALQSWRRPAAASRTLRYLETLLAAQVALVTVLLSGAGLMTHSVIRLLSVDLGFTPPSVLTVTPALPAADRAACARHLREMADSMRAMPGVESASVANVAPLAAAYGGYILRRYDRQVDTLGRDVDPGYFRTVGIPLVAGRDFEPADASRKPVPVILNRQAARALFGGGNGLGAVVECRDKRIGAMQVIGIVGDARVLGAARQAGPQAYAPLTGGWGWASVLVVRGRVQPAAIVGAVRGMDPGSPPPDVQALADILDEESAQPRFYMTLLNCFAFVGLTLAATGAYGVVAYAVAHRTREFGVRIALGAQQRQIIRMVLVSNARAIACGLVAGLAGAAAATRLLSSLLFEVKPRDPGTLAGAGALLAALALAASWLAARRAARVDVGAALRT